MKKILLSPWTATITLILVLILRIADPVFVERTRLTQFDSLITSKPQEVVGVSEIGRAHV